MSHVRILHRGNCGCVSDGHIPDALYADKPCDICEFAFGFGVPITLDDGKLIAHLSCLVEQHEALKASAVSRRSCRRAMTVSDSLATEVQA